MSLSFWPVSVLFFIASCIASLSSLLIPVGIAMLCSAHIWNCSGLSRNFSGVSKIVSTFLDAIPSL